MSTWLVRRSAAWTVALVFVLGFPGLSQAQTAAPELRVMTYVLPPFVIKDGDHLTGFSIELWEEVAARMKVKSRYQMATDVKSTVVAFQTNKVDIAVSAIFYSTELDKVVDFTLPTLDAGMRIMVPGQDVGTGAQLQPLHDWLTLLYSRSAALWLLAALVTALIPAHVVWLLDRRNEDGVSPTKNYFPGIFHSLFWTMTALGSQAPGMPRQWIARTIAVIWIFAGIVFVALFTAQLTALLTVQEIRGAINGPDDLPGKRVGTLAQSVSATYLRKIGADVQEFPSPDETFQALLERKVDAVVLQAPALSYYATHAGRGRVKLVGPEIEKKNMGFVVALGSPLGKRVTDELLAMYEDGTYYRIYAKWFGNE